ncbi:MAG: caspase family protein [Caldimonas sp.]
MKRAAVVIGVDKTGKLTPLTSAARGARRVARWLEGEGFSVACLADDTGDVTRADVEKAIESFVTLPPRYHQLLVYFSGHGYWHARSDLWLLSGAPTRGSEAVNLQGAMTVAKHSGIPNVVFVSDACRSIPASRSGAYVSGGDVFPSYDEIEAESKVDCFRATSEARPAYEGVIDGAAQSVLTAALLAAYEEPDAGMVVQVSENGEAFDVVPNRRLEEYLKQKVATLLEGIDPNATQEIVASVPSADTVYIGRVRTPPPSASGGRSPGGPGPRPPQPTAPRQADPGRSAALAVRSALSDRALDGNTATAVMRPLDPATEGKLSRRLPEAGPDHFETQTGFVVHGAAVQRCAAAKGPHDLQAELLEGGDGRSVPALVRVQHKPPQFVVHEREFASVGVQFEDGRTAVLAALGGYIGHVVVGTNGVANVSYVPSRNHWRYQEYEKRQAEIDRLRALVALATDRETFHVRSEREADTLANRIRNEKGMDPTLGLYAAQAFYQAGNEAQVRSVLAYMRDDLSVDLFDVRLLALRRFANEPAWRPFVPFCPMLSQSWSLLAARGVELAAPLRRALPALCNSLWTTFEPEAGGPILDAIENGDLQ